MRCNTWLPGLSGTQLLRTGRLRVGVPIFQLNLTLSWLGLVEFGRVGLGWLVVLFVGRLKIDKRAAAAAAVYCDDDTIMILWFINQIDRV